MYFLKNTDIKRKILTGSKKIEGNEIGGTEYA